MRAGRRMPPRGFPRESDPSATRCSSYVAPVAALRVTLADAMVSVRVRASRSSFTVRSFAIVASMWRTRPAAYLSRLCGMRVTIHQTGTTPQRARAPLLWASSDTATLPRRCHLESGKAKCKQTHESRNSIKTNFLIRILCHWRRTGTPGTDTFPQRPNGQVHGGNAPGKFEHERRDERR